MLKYEGEVADEMAMIGDKPKESIKFFNLSLEYPLTGKISVTPIGSVDLGTLYSINPDYCIDLAVFSDQMPEPDKIQAEIFRVIGNRDSYIRRRGDDFTIKSYVNRQYATLKCSDPELENLYSLKLIFLHQ